MTDQGFLTESNVVWETLGNVEGDCHFVDSEFHTYTKPEPPSVPVDNANIAVNTDEQIDHELVFTVCSVFMRNQLCHFHYCLSFQKGSTLERKN